MFLEQQLSILRDTGVVMLNIQLSLQEYISLRYFHIETPILKFDLFLIK